MLQNLYYSPLSCWINTICPTFHHLEELETQCRQDHRGPSSNRISSIAIEGCLQIFSEAYRAESNRLLPLTTELIPVKGPHHLYALPTLLKTFLPERPLPRYSMLASQQTPYLTLHHGSQTGSTKNWTRCGLLLSPLLDCIVQICRPRLTCARSTLQDNHSRRFSLPRNRVDMGIIQSIINTTAIGTILDILLPEALNRACAR